MVMKIIKKTYVPVRMPIEAYKNYVKRQAKMENVIKKITKKQIKIPLTKIFLISSENPITLPDELLYHSVKRRKKR